MFINSNSKIEIGNKVMFTDQFNSRDIWEVASVRNDCYGRLYIGIQRSTGIVEYSSTCFVQVV